MKKVVNDVKWWAFERVAEDRKHTRAGINDGKNASKTSKRNGVPNRKNSMELLTTAKMEGVKAFAMSGESEC